MSRVYPLLLTLLILGSGCAYESSGTTTLPDEPPAEPPPAVAPADVFVRTQSIEGGGMLVESVTLPAPGFVVLFADDAGFPGQVIGNSDILPAGVIANVPVAFFAPLIEDTIVHATVHIDSDRSRTFLYEPPADLVDEPGLRANGALATSSALIRVLPALGPASMLAADQITDGAGLVAQDVVLPAAGFVVARANTEGAPGAVIGASALLPAGNTPEVVIPLEFQLDETIAVWLVLHVDRDESGTLDFDLATELPDPPAVDGFNVTAASLVTAVVLPTVGGVVDGHDQEGDGTSVRVDTLVLPADGFAVVRADRFGVPDAVLTVSGLLSAGTLSPLVLPISPPLADGDRVWVEIYTDFDLDGTWTDADRIVTDGAGTPVTARFQVTYPAPPDEPPPDEAAP